jgi:hypothetical protein
MHLKFIALALAGFWASTLAAPTADASPEEPGPGYGLKRSAEEPGPGYGLKRGTNAYAEEPGPGYGL